jgi:long-chain acyl-CoA synthetase
VIAGGAHRLRLRPASTRRRDHRLLPVAWVGDHIFSYAQAILAGLVRQLPRSPIPVVDDRREIGTTYAFAPPRVFESMLTLTMVRMEDASALKRRAFRFFSTTQPLGREDPERRARALEERLLNRVGDVLVYGPLRNRFGLTGIKTGYTAGEAIGPEIFRFYRAIGVNLKQLYGQTEAVRLHHHAAGRRDPRRHGGAPGAAGGHPHRRQRRGAYRSPGVFIGYYKDAEKTAETKTPDGFVRSGDAGFFDTDGHLKIIDRAKDVGRLRDGGLFPPKYVENKLKFYPNIKEAVAFGAERDFVACFINIDLVAVGNWAERNGVTYGSYQELAGHPLVYDMIAKHVDEVNRSLAGEPRMGGRPGAPLPRACTRSSIPTTASSRARRKCGAASSPSATPLVRRSTTAQRGRHIDRGHLRGRPQGRDCGAGEIGT